MAELNDTSFDSLRDKVCEETLKGIKDMGFEKMTKIQSKTIPHLLNRQNVVACAKTGSGKTLAFLIPAVERMHKLKFKPSHGSGVIIISPTRELSMQTFGVLTELMKYHSLTKGLIMGTAKRKREAKSLSEGINILVATPGRLLDHLQHTPQFFYKNLRCLIIDEADRLLDIGFEEDMKQILKRLPSKSRQTLLFSATMSKRTIDFIQVALSSKNRPIYIGMEKKQNRATVEGLQQGYVACESDKRFLILFTFLKKNRKKKVMVFFNSCLSVKFYNNLLNYIDLFVSCIHGKQKQSTRTNAFLKFCEAKSGTLLCTDVAARGLDIPDVDWIVQYDPPSNPEEYIHRVGRTARGESRTGRSVLFLRSEEIPFTYYLKHAHIPLEEYDFNWSKASNVQTLFESLIAKNYNLRCAARKAYKTYIRAYNCHPMKKIFNVKTLDLIAVAKSFGFCEPPIPNLI